MDQVARAREIATEAHELQKRACGEPYINHPGRVAQSVAHLGEVYVATAWLHDVVEDTKWELEQLTQEGFSPEVVEAVGRLTKREGEDYEDFVDRAAETEVSRLVKIADIRDNLRTVDLYKPENRDKYEDALRRLGAD